MKKDILILASLIAVVIAVPFLATKAEAVSYTHLTLPTNSRV